MKKQICLIIALCFFASSDLVSQTKYEKEYGIKSSEVPGKALLFMDSLQFNSRIKWYKEEGLTTTSIEAKTNYKRKKYSIEFDQYGVFEDAEVEVRWRRVSSAVRSEISEYLEEKYRKFQVEKVQLQYTGSPETVRAVLKGEPARTAPTIKYELIIVTRVEKTFKRFEYQFSDAGKFLEMSEVVVRNTDNLIY